ncbi:hypothetical protein C8R43DRAFT_891312 [Mycena crocata]|nr:hypothetical protein C8R43DRAFT_908563 [Mycena crocata]KAJ7144749.1 hypothetical protein C8R43DRAFT_891312 [Mycena crocata]
MNAKQALEKGGGGVEWDELLKLWWQKEFLRAFLGPTRGHLDGRPDQVKKWISYGRKGGPKPPITNAKVFGDEWWGWWHKLNPEWRYVAEDGATMETDESGEWGELDNTGPNGMLNVLICLRWWKDALGEEASKKWDLAVADVTAVLKQMM